MITATDVGRLAIRTIAVSILIVAFVLLLGLFFESSAPAAWCSLRPQTAADADDGKEWRWTRLEGRKCWYRAERKLPRSDLLWEYSAEEFDEGGTVRERKVYAPEDLK